MWYLQIKSYSEDHFELSNQGLHLQGNPTEIKQPPSEVPPRNNKNQQHQPQPQPQPTTTNHNNNRNNDMFLLPERVTLLYMLCSNSSKELVNLHHSALPPQDVYNVYDGKVMGVRPGPVPKKSIRMVTTI